MKKWLVIGSLLVLPLVAYGEEETCVKEKILIQQLSAQNASLIFNNAQAERVRLEAIDKAKEASPGNGTPAQPTNLSVTPEQTPAQ